MSVVLRLIASAILVLSVGCSAPPTQPSPLPLGEPFDVRAGAVAALSIDLVMSFSHVQSDSRCPIDAICVSAGEAVVAVRLDQRPHAPPVGALILVRVPSVPPECETTATGADCLLSTAPGKSTATAIGYTIELLKLAPSRRAATTVPHGDYVATFRVTRN